MSSLIRTLNRNFHRTLRILTVASLLASIIAGMIPPPVVQSVLPDAAAAFVDTLLPNPSTA